MGRRILRFQSDRVEIPHSRPRSSRSRVVSAVHLGRRFMRIGLFVSLLAVPFLGTAAIASATVITFDTVPISSVTSYSESGVTFTALNGSTFSAVPDPNGTNELLSDPSPRIEFQGDTTIGRVAGFS